MFNTEGWDISADEGARDISPGGGTGCISDGDGGTASVSSGDGGTAI